MNPAPPKIVTPGQGPAFIVVGDTYTCLASGEDTNGAFALFHADVPAGHGPPLHTHTREDESFYVLEGEVTFTVGDKHVVAPAGSFVYAPRDIPHRFENATAEPAKMLIQVAPAGFEGYFAEVAQTPEEAGSGPPTAEYLERLVTTGVRYGVIIHPPK
ncbi:MAG: cupin domain-containing protein [Planctomycetota bacterium]|jgi:quercetin dioxygenase-like cupin family protein